MTQYGKDSAFENKELAEADEVKVAILSTPKNEMKLVRQ